MSEFDSVTNITNPQFKKALGKIWDLIRTVIRQLNIVVDQNQDLKDKLKDFQDLLEEKENLLVRESETEKSSNSLLLKLAIERDELFEKNKELNSQIEELKNNSGSNVEFGSELFNYKNEIIELRNKLKDFEIISNSIAEKNLIIIAKNDEINQLKSELYLHQNKLNEFDDNLIKYKLLQNSKNEVEEEVLKLRNEISEKTWIINEFESSLKEKTNLIENLIQQKKELENEKNHLNIILESKDKEFSHLREEKEKIESELTKNKISLKDVIKKIEIYEKDKTKGTSLFNTHPEELDYFKNEKNHLLEKIAELTNLNQKYRNDISKTHSGLLPINFDSDKDLIEKYDELELRLNSIINEKKSLENKLMKLENLLILKSEEFEKLNSLLEKNKEDFLIYNKITKSRILDLKKIMLDKGII